MPASVLSVIRFVRLLLSGHPAVAIENAALRLQLAALRRKRKRPVLTSFDRLFWVGLSRVWREHRGPSAQAAFATEPPIVAQRPDSTGAAGKLRQQSSLTPSNTGREAEHRQ